MIDPDFQTNGFVILIVCFCCRTPFALLTHYRPMPVYWSRYGKSGATLSCSFRPWKSSWNEPASQWVASISSHGTQGTFVSQQGQFHRLQTVLLLSYVIMIIFFSLISFVPVFGSKVEDLDHLNIIHVTGTKGKVRWPHTHSHTGCFYALVCCTLKVQSVIIQANESHTDVFTNRARKWAVCMYNEPANLFVYIQIIIEP